MKLVSNETPRILGICSTGPPHHRFASRALLDGEGVHGESVRPLGGGRARLPYGRCYASLVQRPVCGVHTVVAVEDPHERSEYPIVLGGTGSLLKAGVMAFKLECFFPSKEIEIFGGGLDLLPHSLRRKVQ